MKGGQKINSNRRLGELDPMLIDAFGEAVTADILEIARKLD